MWQRHSDPPLLPPYSVNRVRVRFTVSLCIHEMENFQSTGPCYYTGRVYVPRLPSFRGGWWTSCFRLDDPPTYVSYVTEEVGSAEFVCR